MTFLMLDRLKTAWPRLAICLAAGFFWQLHVNAAFPKITGIQLDGREVVVGVNVPAGVKKVTLESRPRIGSGAWVPRAVSRLDGTGAVLTFRLPKSPLLEILRVRTDADETLPASFYSGTNSFVAGAAVSD